MPDKTDLKTLLTLDDFPKANAYDPRWVLSNLMGPNVLWLTEALSNEMRLEPGMRVLDMGCGKAISSIFLAKEFGVQVWAADLWIDPNENWQRIKEAGCEDSVFPIRAEAHELPFATEFFDAAISMDAYHYFGTSDAYLPYYLKFLKPGAELGIIVPGLTQEFNTVPEHLRDYWEPDMWTFHSPAWWKNHWARTDLVEVTLADRLKDGWQQWLLWEQVGRDFEYGFYDKELEALEKDRGEHLGFTRVIGRKLQKEV